MQTSNGIAGDNFILKKLTEVPFFSIFEKNIEIIKKIAGLCSRKSIKQGKYIITEGEYGEELYIILSGEIEIVKKTLQDDEYTVTTLSADQGSLNVGELGLIDSDRRSASVVAKTDCDCLVIYRKDFIKFGDTYPEAGLAITRVIASQLSAKLRKSNSDVITLFSALVEEIAGND